MRAQVTVDKFVLKRLADSLHAAWDDKPWSIEEDSVQRLDDMTAIEEARKVLRADARQH